MKKNIMRILTCTLIFLAGYGIYVMYCSQHTLTPIQLLKPTGTLTVGTTAYHLVDTDRYERHSLNPNAHRELMLQIWYPAQPSNLKKASYAHPRAIELMQEWLEAQTHIPAKELDYLKTLETHSITSVPILPGHYPTIIFSPGWGGPVNMYTALLEELASHGYIVVGINYPYVTNPVVFPDGRTIIAQEEVHANKAERRKNRESEYFTWAADVQFVINQLAQMNANTNNIFHNKLDLTHLGILGHSFGGSIAVGMCQLDTTSFQAGIDIDGKLHPWHQEQKLKRPFMFIVALHSDETLHPIKELVKSSTVPVKYVEIPKADHGSFTDLYLLAKWKSLPQLDPCEGLQITRKYIVNFFDTYLKTDVP